MICKVILFLLLVIISCNQKRQNRPETTGTDTLVLEARLEFSAKALLGEGAIWDYEPQLLWWVDIENHTCNLYDPVVKENEAMDMGQRIGTVVPARNRGKAVVALQDGIYELDLESMLFDLVCSPESSLKDMRFNDGKCDPTGRLWVGSMSMNFIGGAASLYRVSEDGDFKKMIDSVTVSNGIVWTSDHKTMYYNDTPTGCVKAYDFDLSSGEISNERIAVIIPSSMGAPDGMTIDSADKLWVAHWGGGMVGRWDPLTGKLLAKVVVPAPNVTSCAFGGPELDVLYITTAREGMSEDDILKYPEAGSIFKVAPGVNGVTADFWGK
ncbi:MAG TPA: SMP-30/gluconolactonase/LRE family protein [Cyclobacteriaceae bacterium]|nr:SMP-30/gluconolactonase/LRE family protein [Cyclobacteriaceae bacterium]